MRVDMAVVMMVPVIPLVFARFERGAFALLALLALALDLDGDMVEIESILERRDSEAPHLGLIAAILDGHMKGQDGAVTIERPRVQVVDIADAIE
jgi:hypothetical protein